jgi:hypothetical protein
MATLTQSTSGLQAGWGDYRPAEAVHSVAQLRPGDVVLQRARKPGFPRPCLHVLEVIGGDPSGNERPFVRVRLLDPTHPTRSDSALMPWIVLWDFCLTEGRAELFMAAHS